jgi:hypothetical protein
MMRQRIHAWAAQQHDGEGSIMSELLLLLGEWLLPSRARCRWLAIHTFHDKLRLSYYMRCVHCGVTVFREK